MAYRYKMLEHENHVLKQQVMHINSSVIHLWEIKEAEYSNLFDIMESVRNAWYCQLIFNNLTMLTIITSCQYFHKVMKVSLPPIPISRSDK